MAAASGTGHVVIDLEAAAVAGAAPKCHRLRGWGPGASDAEVAATLEAGLFTTKSEMRTIGRMLEDKALSHVALSPEGQLEALKKQLLGGELSAQEALCHPWFHGMIP